MTDPVIRKSIFLKATPEKVWQWLTDPEKLAIWFHKPPSPLVQGEDYELIGQSSGERLIHGHVTQARAPHYLEYTFLVKPMGDHETLVKWTLTEVPGGTHLSMEHSALPVGEAGFGMTLSFDKGWDEHIDRMRSAIHDG